MTRNFQKLMKFNRPHNHNLKLNKPKGDKKWDNENNQSKIRTSRHIFIEPKWETFEDIQRGRQGILYPEEGKSELQHVSCQNMYKTEDNAVSSFYSERKK